MVEKCECQETSLNVFKMEAFSKNKGNLSKFNVNENKSGKLNIVL